MSGRFRESASEYRRAAPTFSFGLARIVTAGLGGVHFPFSFYKFSALSRSFIHIGDFFAGKAKGSGLWIGVKGKGEKHLSAVSIWGHQELPDHGFLQAQEVREGPEERQG